jgi:tricarballylate dehydrogenase
VTAPLGGRGSSAVARATADRYDVAILGGGNAALCAALSARQAGRSVVIVERAPRHLRGGNSRHTRNLRCAHGQPTDVLTGAYEDDEFVADLHRVNGGESNGDLTRLLIRESRHCAGWMARHGVRFQAALRGTLQLSRTNAFFLGGGKALMNAYYAAAARLGIDVLYDADVVALDLDGGTFRAATIVAGGERRTLRARAAVVATGGFESNLEWLKEAWGDAADNFVVRGTPYNTGTVLRLLLDAGAVPVGDPRGCHAIAVDARAPRFDGGIVTRLDCIPLGIVVNRDGARFADEGEDLWPKRYASWGALIAGQPDQQAYCLIDAKAAGRFMPSVFPAIEARSVRELAQRLQLPPDRVLATVDAFNAAVRPGAFDLEVLDGCRTEGLAPPKSHWAQRLDTPPFRGYPLRPGITFTYLGVTVDEASRVVIGGSPSRNLFAAGEVMAGNVLRRGYLAGIGMTIGTVFGRLAGEHAADAAR